MATSLGIQYTHRSPICQQIGGRDDEDPAEVRVPDERLDNRDHLQRLPEARVVSEKPADVVRRLEQPLDALDLVWLEYLRAGNPGTRGQAGRDGNPNLTWPRVCRVEAEARPGRSKQDQEEGLSFGGVARRHTFQRGGQMQAR